MGPITVIEPCYCRGQDDQLFLAGERAQAGLYRSVVTQREILLERDDSLPATCDGQVACYKLVYNLSPNEITAIVAARTKVEGVHS